MGKRAILYATLAVVAVGLWAFYKQAVRSSRGGEETPLYSTRRYDPYGTAALKELLVERGYEVISLERPRIDPSMNGALVQALPLSGIPGFFYSGFRSLQLQTKSLREWVEAGNTVLQLTRDTSPVMYEVFDIKVEIATQEASIKTNTAWKIQEHQAEGKFPDTLPGKEIWAYPPVNISGNSADSPAKSTLLLRSPRFFDEFASKPGFKPLAISEDDHIVACEISLGRGRLIMVGAPSPVLNHGINKGENLDFILETIGPGPVIFDEWSHGIGHGGTVIGLIKEVGLAPVIFQAIFVIGLYIWSTLGYRRIDRDREIRLRSSIEQIETLGHLYGEALSRSEKIKRVENETGRRLAAALGCAPENIAKRCDDIHPDIADEIREIIDTLDRLKYGTGRKKGVRTDAELARVLTLSHKIEGEMDRERKNQSRTG